jgi:ubiquinone/menaquinone biosynthesis C-methylase UbiE
LDRTLSRVPTVQQSFSAQAINTNPVTCFIDTDQTKIDEFAERILKETNAGMSCLNLYLGHRLGLFRTIADSGPVTSIELSRATNCSERYLREWLGCMAAGGYLDHDPGTDRFSLPPEHAVVLLDRDSAAYTAPKVAYIQSFASVLDRLAEAFRSGGGVPYESYGPGFVDALGWGNRTLFVNDYLARWIPAVPGLRDRLAAGGRVLEVGCGVGWSSIALALGFPRARIDAIDADGESIAQARRNSEEAGVAERIAFCVGSMEESPLEGPYDLATAFDTVHDLAHPVKALRRMREVLAPDGSALIADEKVGETLEENSNFFGHLMYNFSVLHCLPQAMATPDSAATGALMSQSRFRGYALEAGFSRVDVLPIESPFWRFYRLTP